MKKVSTKFIVLNGLMIALVFAATRFTAIPSPIPPGYFNLGDAIIMTGAVLLGRRTGLIAGALGSMLADIAYGAFIYAPVTFVVKGLEGYIIGILAENKQANRLPMVAKITLSTLVGAIFMVAGYFVSEATFLRAIDENLGFAAAVTNLPTNIAQGGTSVVVAVLLLTALLKSNAVSGLKGV